MTVHSTLIVLSSTRIRGNSQVIHTLSREWGKRSFLVSLSPQVPPSLFMALNVLDAEVVPNDKSDLWRLKNIKAVYPLNSIRSSLYKNAISLFMSEVLYKTLSEGDAEQELFDWCVRSILTLDTLEDNYPNYHLLFLLELCTALGFQPSPEDLAPFAGRNLQLIRELADCDTARFLALPLSGAIRSEVALCLLDYLSHHIDSPITINSLPVLKEIFSTI